ncbi:sugar transferase [uncultured Tenacibaculum sp.]|uniref:sugar transferase n=1 Tax=uncultured Tenacibaculum sp. TaxID=174713 RepID=UPI002619C517|nr:sugar transferase [uncultured Tenacibaculum sp.]
MFLTFKRIFDCILAIFLIFALIPIYLIIALIIFCQDFGTPIFKQIRVGKSGKEFMFYKFRSMPLKTPNVESHERSKLTITPFGKFIRRTNLDELPQFFNVLKGDMSFIGPRPPIPSQTNLIELRKNNKALFLKPGLTGWAQVNSFDNMPEEEKARFDGEYAERISMSMDLLILAKTVVYFTKKPPTY